MRLGVGQLRLRRTPLDFTVLLFFLTLFVGLWASYSARLALNKFWMLVAAVVIYYVITAVPRRYALWVAVACGMIAAGLSLFFLTADLWHRSLAFAGGFFPPFYRLLTLRMFWPLLLPHPNVIGGHIAMLLPFTIATLLYAHRDRRTRLGISTAVCLIVALVGLALTRSVGALLALAAGLGIWVLWPISVRFAAVFSWPRRLIYSLFVALLVLAGAAATWLSTSQGLPLPGGQKLVERLAEAGGAWRLVQDYSWLGSGLVSFPALYSEYVQVVPNFYLIYSNFYLDVWLELGLVGFICLLAIWAGAWWLIVSALWRSLGRPHPQRGDVYWLRWATLASLITVLVHGLVDDVLFGGLGTPLLFLTPAMAVVVSRHKAEVTWLFFSKRTAWLTAVTLLILAVLLGISHRRVLSNWYAHWGAQTMDNALLKQWPDNQWRHGYTATLMEPAQQQLARALEWDSHNRTAHQRLGMIALWDMEMDTAVFHLQEAYAQDPAHRGVIKLLGYAYVWQGQPEKAYPLLAQIPEASREMEEYLSFWRQRNRLDLSEKTAAFLNNHP